MSNRTVSAVAAIFMVVLALAIITGAPSASAATAVDVQLTVTLALPNQPPVAVTTGPYSTGVGATLELSGALSYDPDPGDTITKYEWDLDNNGTFEKQGVSVNVSFATTGEYTVRLRVTDSHGVTDTTTTVITVTATDECIVDNSDDYAHKKFEELGGIWAWEADTDAYLSEYVWAETSDSSATASGRWSCTTLPAGKYQVYAWWIGTTDRSTTVPYIIKNGATELDTVIVDQTQILGTDPVNDNWHLLGTYDFDTGQHVVEINNQLTKNVSSENTICADAIRFKESVPTECVVDNKDPGFSILSGTWGTSSSGTKIWPLSDPSANYRWVGARTGDETARARFACATLPAGDYEAFAWWPQLSYSMGENVPYQIFHSGGSTTVRKNQNQNGGQWVSLGTYAFLAGAHRVEVHNGQAAPGAYVAADAVKFIKAP